MTSHGNQFPHQLEVEVEAELDLIDASASDLSAAGPVAQWQFDPIDVEREEVGLQNLLGAAQALDAAPHSAPARRS